MLNRYDLIITLTFSHCVQRHGIEGGFFPWMLSQIWKYWQRIDHLTLPKS